RSCKSAQSLRKTRPQRLETWENSHLRLSRKLTLGASPPIKTVGGAVAPLHFEPLGPSGLLRSVRFACVSHLHSWGHLCYSLSKGPFARISPPYNPLFPLVGINVIQPH